MLSWIGINQHLQGWKLHPLLASPTQQGPISTWHKLLIDLADSDGKNGEVAKNILFWNNGEMSGGDPKHFLPV